MYRHSNLLSLTIGGFVLQPSPPSPYNHLKKTGWVSGPLKEDWERQLVMAQQQKTTSEQGKLGQLQNTFDF